MMVSYSPIGAHVCAESSALLYGDVRKYELKRSSCLHLHSIHGYARGLAASVNFPRS